MAEKFDPYHLWLGIAEQDQPAHHYCLLGIARFESDPEIIENAADQRIAFVRTFQTGKNAKECQRVLNELAAARVCLLDQQNKAAYDKQLRAQLVKKQQEKKAAASGKSGPRKELKTRRKPTAEKSPATTGKKRQKTSKSSGPSKSSNQSSTSPSASRRRKKRSAFPVSWAIAIAAVLLIGLGAAFLTRGGSNKDKEDEVARGVDSTATVKIDPVEKSADKQDKSQGKKKNNKPPKKSPRTKPDDSKAGSQPLQPGDGKPETVSLPRIPEQPPKEESDPLPGPTLNDPLDKPGGEPQEPKPEPMPDPEPPVQRQPVPETTAMEEMLKQVRRYFPFDEARTDEQKSKLAADLFKASDDSEAPTERYVLLDQTRQLAQQAGDFRLALDAIATMGEMYDVDDLAFAEAVVRGMRIPTKLRDENRALAQASSDLMWRAVDENKFDLAIKLGTNAASVARRVGDIDMVKEMAVHLKQIRTQQTAHAALSKALEKLETAPDDPAANFEAGRYYSLLLEDWQTGLPYLSRSQEDPWSSLAEEELGVAEDSAAQLALGNHWWDLAEKHKDSEKAALLRHAATWYDEALPSLNQLERIRIEKRLATLEDLEPGRVSKPRLPSDGLVAHYSFDGRTGDMAKDLIGKRDGKIFSAQRVPGHLGRALRFDGLDDAVVIPNLETLLGGTASLAAWIKTQQRGDAKFWLRPGLAGFERPGEMGDVFWGILDPVGRIGITCGNNGAANSTTSVSDDQWHHVVLMREADSGRVAVAVDGQVQHENFSGSGVITQGFRTLGYVSQSQGKKNPAGFYSGLLDDVRIYNRVLTAAEIATFVGKGTGRTITLKRPTAGRRPSRGKKGPVPVVHWPLDEGQGTEVKDAMGRVHVRVVGAQWIEGVSGSALRFDGRDDFIEVPRIGTNDAFTLAMWIRPESLRPKFSSLFHNHGWSDLGLHVHVQSSGRFTFDIKGIKRPGQGGESLSSRSPIRPGIWQHVAVAYDKNAGKAVQYINGQLDATHAILNRVSCQFGPGRIGGWDKLEELRFFHGTIDDVRLYDRALSLDEMTAVIAESRKKRRGR